MAVDKKDTIYIDVDDEITGIIDKLRGSDSKVVALVLPKRAAVFQSIVNMKLLKRAADAGKQNVVLITSEPGLMPLAGAAGLHVAKTLTSKPEIPVGPGLPDESEEMVDESEAYGGAGEPLIDPNQPVGDLANSAALTPPLDNGVETIALDDDELPPEAAPDKPKAPKNFEPPKAKKDKKLKIPNFNRFRLIMALIVLILILLIGGFIFANAGLKKATVNIQTDASNINVNQNLDLSTSAETLDSDGSRVPAKLESYKKTYTQEVTTTGQKNEGNEASGSVTITNCGTSSETIPAGTGFSASGETFISQSDVTVPVSTFLGRGGNCQNNGTANVNVMAQSPGSSYNLPSNTTFTIASSPPYTTAEGSTSGGTDNIVQTVNQNDINNAKSKISTNNSSAKQSLESQIRADGYYPLSATFSTGTPNVTSSADVGEAANSVTVTETINYTEFGVHESDLKSVLANNIDGQINSSKQSILDDGLSSASYTLGNQGSSSASLVLTTKAEVGPELDETNIKTEVEGMKAGAIKSQLSSNPDVTGVSVKFSPFWVSSAPKNASKITINIAKPTSTQSSN
jgi:hypothetical protein